MMRAKKSLEKKSKKGFKGYPMATIAFYGPSNQLATKIALGIISYENAEPIMMKWMNSEIDIRHNEPVMKEILKAINEGEAKSVLMVDKIIGCPHEEGMDYPEGESCQQCPYWLNRNRWTGDIFH